MFAGSVGNQDEFIAVQFKSGRPWFLFDPQGKCNAFTGTIIFFLNTC